MIVNFDNLSEIERPIIYTVGTYDILHIGHIHFLEEAKKVAPDHRLLVGIIPDTIVRERKGTDRPVMGQDERALVVDSLQWVDYTFVAPAIPVGETSKLVIDLLRPEYSVISREDWDSRPADWQASGTNLVKLDKIPEQSSTKIIQKIKD